MEVRDGKEDLLRELIVGLTPLVSNVEAMKGQLYMTLAGYDVTQATRELAVCDESLNETLIKKFLVAKSIKGCTKRTIEMYGNELHRHLAAIGKSVPDITTDDLRKYMVIKRVRDKNSKTQIHNIYRVFSTFYAWLRDEEYLQHNPVIKLDMRKPKVHKEAFTAIEVEKIRAAVETNRERAVIELLLSTGCRVTELCNILLSEIKGDRILIHGKGEKDRIVYMNARARVAVDAYLEERSDDNPYLFPRMISIEAVKNKAGGKSHFKKYWYRDPELVEAELPMAISSVEITTRKIGKKIGVSPCNPHRFRHTCATLALKRGMDIMTVSKMLGHEDVGTTQVYLDVDEEQLAIQHDKYVL